MKNKSARKFDLIYNKPTTLVIWVLLINIACTALEARPTGKWAQKAKTQDVPERKPQPQMRTATDRGRHLERFQLEPQGQNCRPCTMYRNWEVRTVDLTIKDNCNYSLSNSLSHNKSCRLYLFVRVESHDTYFCIRELFFASLYLT